MNEDSSVKSKSGFMSLALKKKKSDSDLDSMALGGEFPELPELPELSDLPELPDAPANVAKSDSDSLDDLDLDLPLTPEDIAAANIGNSVEAKDSFSEMGEEDDFKLPDLDLPDDNLPEGEVEQPAMEVSEGVSSEDDGHTFDAPTLSELETVLSRNAPVVSDEGVDSSDEGVDSSDEGVTSSDEIDTGDLDSSVVLTDTPVSDSDFQVKSDEFKLDDDGILEKFEKAKQALEQRESDAKVLAAEFKEKELTLKQIEAAADRIFEKEKAANEIMKLFVDLHKEYESNYSKVGKSVDKYAEDKVSEIKDLYERISYVQDRKFLPIMDAAEKIKNFKGELKKIEHTVDSKFKDFEQKSKAVKKLQKDLNTQSRSLEKLDRKISDEKDILDIRESDYKDRLKDLNAREKEINKSELKIENDFMKINDAKSLKAKLPLLEKKYSELEKQFNIKSKEIARLDVDYQVKHENLKEREDRLFTLEKELQLKSESLAKREQRIADMQEDMLNKQAGLTYNRFDSMLNEELMKLENGQNRFATSYVQNPRHEELYSLIGQAKLLISKNDVANAKQVYAQIGGLFDKIDARDTEKKNIYYQLLELKTDIELASLN